MTAIFIIWQRQLIRYWRSKSRIVGSIGQPLLFLLALGFGLNPVFKKAGIGHTDCMGLLIANNSSINLIPELINKNKNASLTHEASVGKISEENLNYLRSRGLTEEQAIDLIVAGFLANDKK